MVAYHPGNAANVPAAATTSQTSLPSQSGPMVAIPGRRGGRGHGAGSGLVAADDAVQHADTEVEPLEDEEPDPQHGQDEEPEGDEGHGEPPPIGNRSRAPASAP